MIGGDVLLVMLTGIVVFGLLGLAYLTRGRK